MSDGRDPGRCAPLVIGLGEILWDMLPGGRQLGGAPANFAYHAACLGARAEVMSAVGDDALGREILAELDSRGLGSGHVALDRSHPTGTVTVEIDGGGKPRYIIHEDVAWDHIPVGEGALRLAGEADAICYGSLAQRGRVSRESIRAVLGAARPGCLRVCDINLRQSYYDRERLEGSLGAADILKLNDEELPVVSAQFGIDGDDERATARALREAFDLRMVAVTLGGRGSLFVGEDVDVVHPGTPAGDIVDTVGAGDAFSAALVMGLLGGVAWETIAERANRLASFVCTRAGAMPPHPER